MIEEGSDVPITIAHQGAVRVNAASAFMASENIMLVYVDLHSKRAEVMASGNGNDRFPPSIMFCANENTLHLDEAKPREDLTEIWFPTLIGWKIFSVDGPGRYTVSVAFYRENNDE